MGRRTNLDAARTAALLLGIAGTLSFAPAYAQLYKWKDAKGVVHYGDTPPPTRLDVIQLPTAQGAVQTASLPYELARAARNNPVTLYSAASCGACDAGRALLRARGIPFAEKTIDSAADQQQLRQAGSDGKLPLLLVGRDKLIGFEAGAWNDALSAAAYPSNSMLPSSYREMPAQPAAPPAAAPAAVPEDTQRQEAAERAAIQAEAQAQAAARARKRPPENAPPDFQF